MKSLLAAAVAVALSLSAAARAGALVDVSVIDRDTGSTLPTHRHDGRLYVAGVPGHRYTVRLHNRTGARVLTVLSVDGVNAITGQTADPRQSGYVLGAHATTDVGGWRKNMSEVAQFNFTSLADSYAARTGRPANVGVIGVAVFREKVPLWRRYEDEIASREAQSPATADGGATGKAAASEPARAAEAAKSANAPSAARDSRLAARQVPRPQESLGTGHGARESSHATYTAFERASDNPDEIDSIWYDSFRNLVARGVIPRPRPLAVEPQPFPNGGFVPDPAG